MRCGAGLKRWSPCVATVHASVCAAMVASLILLTLSALPPVSYLSPGPVSLPASSAGALGVLLRVPPSGAPQPMARSYDGYAWEGTHPEPLNVTHCAHATSCDVKLPRPADGSTYSLSWRQGEDATVQERVARFLMHASFGPTRASVDVLASGDTNSNLMSWVAEQINELSTPPSLHRAHLRRRANPRNLVVVGTGGVRQVTCCFERLQA